MGAGTRPRGLGPSYGPSGWTGVRPRPGGRPALGAKLTAEKYGADFNLDLRRETRSNTLQLPFLHSPDTAANGLFWVSRDRLAGPIYEALRAGGMDKLPDPDKVVDMSLLREAHRR